ncbi:MAG TPA: hypothetical protein VG474_01445 [Solirubrobacteraceae bacterium]|nr:hypothetical protein [Solirubrobacteraceae bacterium]
MSALRYIDLVLLGLTVPVALVLGAPELGVLLAAAVWTVQRLVALAVDRRARLRMSPREALGLNLATMIVRMWMIGATIVVAGVAGSRKDGVAAAVVLLVAFTVAFVVTLMTRSLGDPAARPGTPRHA